LIRDLLENVRGLHCKQSQLHQTEQQIQGARWRKAFFKNIFLFAPEFDANRLTPCIRACLIPRLIFCHTRWKVVKMKKIKLKHQWEERVDMHKHPMSISIDTKLTFARGRK